MILCIIDYTLKHFVIAKQWQQCSLYSFDWYKEQCNSPDNQGAGTSKLMVFFLIHNWFTKCCQLIFYESSCFSTNLHSIPQTEMILWKPLNKCHWTAFDPSKTLQLNDSLDQYLHNYSISITKYLVNLLSIADKFASVCAGCFVLIQSNLLVLFPRRAQHIWKHH